MTRRPAVSRHRHFRGAARAGLLMTLAAVAAPPPSAEAQVFPAGFAEETLISTLAAPTCLAFAPDGRLFIGELGGAIKLWDGGGTATTLVTLPVVQDGEMGLLGLALDPGFPSLPYVYAFYTLQAGGPSAPVNRIARFTFAGSNIALASEVILLDGIPTGIGSHVGGCIRFGPGGNLYAATGDTGWSTPFPQDLSRLEGKLLRLRPDGSVPADNPFVNVPGARPEIYQWGFRNPFRFSIQPATGIPFVADVGWYAWEEIDMGPPGANFGWPQHEGAANPPDPATVDPIYAYDHSFGPAAIAGNVFYSGTFFPAEYRGNFFFLDHVRGTLGRMVLDANNAVVSVVPDWVLSSSYGPGTGPVDLTQGPDGALYYCTLFPGEVRRLYYAGGGNRAPVAVAGTHSPAAGYPPLAVWFNGSQSYDADGDSLRFTWDFGDASHLAHQVSPVHAYFQIGVYEARLTVTDGRGGSSTAPPVRITVGNLPPTPTITLPALNSQFVLGQVIAFAGAANDPEEGPVPPQRLHWNVTLNEPGHSHPVLQNVAGAGGTFVAFPTDEPVNQTFYRITLRAEDATGLGAERSVDVRPDTLQAGTTDAAPPASSGLRLLGSSPNPFNPETVIQFELASAGRVRLEVADVRGRCLRVLWDGDLTRGLHGVRWDGKTRTGAAAPSGVYLASVRSGSATATCRLVLLR